MTGKGLGFTAIVADDQQVLGIFTDGDLRRLIERGADLRGLVAQQVMHPSPRRIRVDALAVDAADLMEQYRITSVLVVDERSRLVGRAELQRPDARQSDLTARRRNRLALRRRAVRAAFGHWSMMPPALSFAPELLLQAQGVRAAIFDVDGVLTDGRLYIGEHGEDLQSIPHARWPRAQAAGRRRHHAAGGQWPRLAGVAQAIERPRHHARGVRRCRQGPSGRAAAAAARASHGDKSR